MPNYTGYGVASGLSSFAQGFGQVFAATEAEKRRAQTNLAHTTLEAMLKDPALGDSKEAQALLAAGYGKEGAAHAMTLVQARKAIPDPVAQLLMPAPDQAPTPVPGSATSGPIADSGGMQGAVADFARSPNAGKTVGEVRAAALPPGATDVVKGRGQSVTLRSTRTVESEKEAAFAPVWQHTYDQMRAENPAADDAALRLHALDAAARIAGPESLPKRLLDVQSTHIKTLDRKVLDLEFAPQQAAASARGRESVTGPAIDARMKAHVAEMEALHTKHVAEQDTRRQKTMRDAFANTPIGKQPGYAKQPWRNARGQAAPPELLPGDARAQGYGPTDPGTQNFLSKMLGNPPPLANAPAPTSGPPPGPGAGAPSDLTPAEQAILQRHAGSAQ